MVGELRRRASAQRARDAAGACELLWKTPVRPCPVRRHGRPQPARPRWDRSHRARGARVRHGPGRAAAISLPASGGSRSVPVSTWRTGDVFARAYVRWLEVQRSFAFIEEQLGSLPPGDTRRRWQARAARRRREHGGRMARRHLPRRASPTARAVRAGTRWSTHLSGTGSGLPLPCAGRRCQTSRCATRASTCRIAGTICEAWDKEC